jgi:hypothetical protein
MTQTQVRSHAPISLPKPVDPGQATSMANTLLADIEQTPPDPDPVAERRRRAERLVVMAGRERWPLEDLRDRYVKRLHSAGPDFVATEALRTVEIALSMTPRPEDLVRQERERERSRGWRQRWRRRWQRK